MEFLLAYLGVALWIGATMVFVVYAFSNEKKDKE